MAELSELIRVQNVKDLETIFQNEKRLKRARGDHAAS